MISEADNLSSTVSPPAKASASVMSGSVAREISVTATGARPGTNAANRALFNEETTSVLISEKGAVIRLCSAVVVGQLVFITNNESRREVVAQVVRVRAFRPTTCYVEMEFTEPAPGFWGVDFKTESTQSLKDPNQTEMIAAVRSAKPAATESRAHAATPTDQEVSALKDEVAALREQLKSLRGQALPAKAPEPFPLPEVDFLPVEPLEIPASAKTPSFEFMSNSSAHEPSAPPVVKASSTAASLPTAPAAPPRVESELPADTSSLPLDHEQPPASAQFYVPQPASTIEHSVATDVSSSQPLPAPAQAPRTNLPRIPALAAKKSVRASGSFTPGVQTLLRRIVAPGLTLLAFAGVLFWRGPMLLSLITGKPASTASASSKPAPRSIPAAPKMAPSVPGSDSQKFTVASNPQVLNFPDKDAVVAVVDPPVSDRTGDRFLDASIVEKKRAGKGAHSAGPKINPTHITFSDLSRGSVNDPSVVPPQLVKSVKAVAPPEALRRFFTGNVLVQAVVDPTGRVALAKAVSGPPSLYQAAVDTIKEYRFAPATRNGQAVPARVELTINFWFEP